MDEEKDKTVVRCVVTRACTFCYGELRARKGEAIAVPRHIYEDHRQALTLASEMPADEEE
jgi:hypothetical protein